MSNASIFNSFTAALAVSIGLLSIQSAQADKPVVNLDTVLRDGAYSSSPVSLSGAERLRDVRALAYIMIKENEALGLPGEARVGAVIMNRRCANWRWYGGDNIVDIIASPLQFSPINGPGRQAFFAWVDAGSAGPADKVKFERLFPLASALLDGWRPREIPSDVYHFVNPRTATDRSWYDPSKVIFSEAVGHDYLLDVDQLGSLHTLSKRNGIRSCELVDPPFVAAARAY